METVERRATIPGSKNEGPFCCYLGAKASIELQITSSMVQTKKERGHQLLRSVLLKKKNNKVQKHHTERKTDREGYILYVRR